MIFSLIGKGMLKIGVHEYSGHTEKPGIFGGNGLSDFLINYSVLFLIVFLSIALHHKITVGPHSQNQLESTLFQALSVAFLLIVIEAFVLIGYVVLTEA